MKCSTKFNEEYESNLLKFSNFNTVLLIHNSKI